MIFKNGKVYDWLKWIALVALDALGFAYNEVSQVWGWPYGEQIYKTCTIVAALIGVLIGVSGIRYSKLNGSNKIEKLSNDEIAQDAEDLINGI